MKSSLKTALPLVLLFVIVFGVILITQYTPSGKSSDPELQRSASGEPPLRFFTSARIWDPTSESLSDQVFPGFYEKDARGSADFWFENRNDKPVVVQLKGVNCGSCSDGWLAPIPLDTTRSILEMSAIGALPQGLFNGLSLGLSGAAAGVAPERLARQSHEFRSTDWTFNVPAANNPTGWTPQWGIMTLNFKAGQRQELAALFACQVQGTTQYAENEFKIAYVTVNPFEVSLEEIKVGDLDDNSTQRSYEFVVFSLTRGEGTTEKLPPPIVRVQSLEGGADTSPFVTVSPSVPLLAADLDRFVEDLQKKGGRVRVRSAYRVNVTLAPKVGEKRLDVGVLERELWIACGDAQLRVVRLRGTVRGGVRLSEGKEIDLKSFQFKTGFTEKEFEIVTDNPAIEVSLAKTEVEERGPDGMAQKVMRDHVVVNGRVAPDVLKVSVARQDRKEPDRGYFTVKVSVPPDAHQGQFQNSYIVLDLKGPVSRRFQIPVKGAGTR